MAQKVKQRFQNHREQLFSNRMVEQDIAKGLMIFAVVFCHSVPLTQTADIILRSVLGMVIPFFFFISGYNYKNPDVIPPTFKGKALLYWQRVKKRLRQILVPLLFCSVVLLGFGVGYAYLTKQPDGTALGMVKAFGGFWISEPISSAIGFPTIGTYEGIQRLFEPNWFILHMTLAYVVFYAVVDWALSNKKRYISVMFALVAVACIFNYFHLKMPWGLENSAAYAAIMLMGCGVKRKKLFSEERYSHKYWPWINCAVCFLICIALGFLWPRAGQISGSGQITKIFDKIASQFGILEIPFTIIYSVIASYYLIWACKLLKKVRPVKFFFSYLGRNSLMILVFHLIFVAAANAICKTEMGTSLEYVEVFEPMKLVVFALSIIMCLIFVTLNVLGKENNRKLIKLHKLCKEKAKELSANKDLSKDEIKRQVKIYRKEMSKTIKIKIA